MSSKRLKVLHLIPSLEMGGAQKLLGDMLPLMNKQADIRVVVCQSGGSQIELGLKKAGIEIVSLETGLRSISAVKKIIPLLKESDVAHVHLFPMNYVVALANTFVRKPIIFTEHSTHNRRRNHSWLRIPEKWMYSQYDKICCISGPTESALLNWVKSHRIGGKTIVIENGISLNNFSKRNYPPPFSVFGRKGIPIMMISRFTDSKDHDTVLRALPLVENKNTYIVFVGDGDRRKAMENLSKELGIQDRVLFLGTRADIAKLAGTAYIGVQASNWEGFGLTAVEMMASGTPVIASDVEGLRQVVEDAGLLFQKNDTIGLATKINRLLSDQELYNRLIIKGREKANLYSIERTADNYLNLYKSLA